MAMGTRRQRERQEGFWYRCDLAEAPGHPFYNKLNQSIPRRTPQSSVTGGCFRTGRSHVGATGLKQLKSEEGLANPTLDRIRRVMSLVYRHGQRCGLIPRRYESNPMRFVRCKTTSGYEAMILTPGQAYAIVRNLRDPERTLTILAAGTGLRISECLGLQWQDVSFADAMIHVRRTWTCGQVGLPKTKASKGPVPLHPLLAEFMFCWNRSTPYPKPTDWVFPSLRSKGKRPRVANMLVEDHLRPAAAKAGILSSHRDENGRMVEDDPRRFGFHNLRHSLASFLIRARTDPKTVQTPLPAAMSN
jgi:integrase